MKSVGVPQRLDACLRVLLMDVYGAWRVSYTPHAKPEDPEP